MVFETTINGIDIKVDKSTRKGKKLMAKYMGEKGRERTIHFGAEGMQHYKDVTKIWSHLDHKDAKRHKSFWKRHGCKDLSSGINARILSCYLLWPKE